MKFCQTCGAPQDDEAVFCNKCGAQQKNSAVFCSKCGAPQEDGAAFCNKCGAPLSVAQSAPQQAYYQAPNGQPSYQQSYQQPQQTYYQPVQPVAPAPKRTRFKPNLDVIITTSLSVLAFIFLFIPGFATCYDIGEYCHYYEESYFEIVDWYEFGEVIFILSMLVALVGVIAFGWLGFGKKKTFGVLNIIFSGVSVISFLISSIYAYFEYGGSYYSYYSGEYYYWGVDYLGALFYITLMLLLGLVAISVLNTCGIFLIKKKTVNVNIY